MHINQLRVGTTAPPTLRLGTVPVERAYLGDVLVYGEEDNPVPTYPEMVLQHAPLVYWRLNESAGAIALDSSGHGRDGAYANLPALGGLSLLADGSGHSVYFDDMQGERVTAAYGTWMNSADVTMTSMFMMTHTTTSLQMLASRYQDGTSDVSWFLYRENNEFKFWYRGMGGQEVAISSGVVGELGKAYFVAAYAGVSGAGIRVYSLGTLLGSATGAGYAVSTSTRPFVAAGCDSAVDYTLKGSLQEIACFGTSLSISDLDVLGTLATTPQPAWLSQTSGVGARNGTASHTVSFAPASPGSLLVAVVTGGVISTATTPGWTKRLNPTTQVELAVFTCSAGGGETSLALTHNGSNYPINYTVYEFPAGTSWETGADNPNGQAPDLSALPGAPVVVFTAVGMASANGADPLVTTNWGFWWTGDTDTMTPYTGTTEGAYLTTGWRRLTTETSVSPATEGYFAGPVYIFSDQINVMTTVTFALRLPGS